MCGEHISTVGCHDVKAGSSPHVRGARGLLLPRGIVLGIIPACAGSTSYLAAIFHLPRDHPRMCGEHRNIIACICVSLGSSPHVRGAQKHCRHRRGVPGIIPACAGSTQKVLHKGSEVRDHPRMCGEHRSIVGIGVACQGSSPHVRGALNPATPEIDQTGIIPACAGSTTPSQPTHLTSRDHPRMCGEHCRPSSAIMSAAGSSPHVRGAPQDYVSRYGYRGIIPACAGSTYLTTKSAASLRDHPRMCGEHVSLTNVLTGVSGSSPHVRGARCQVGDEVGYFGIIPACAGSTEATAKAIAAERDHPRMCGEHHHMGVRRRIRWGSSPHVRGAPVPRC